LCRQLTYTQPLATGLATLAWIRQAAGDAAGAVDAIAEATRVAPSPEVADLLNPVPAQRTRLLLAHGDLTAATSWVDQRGLGAADEASYPREPAYLVLARVLLAKGEADPALDLLRRLYADAAAGDRAGSVIEIQALRALALRATGDEVHAMTALEEAIASPTPRVTSGSSQTKAPPWRPSSTDSLRTNQACRPPAAAYRWPT
jgi:LuxR family maltose regulon positive regulatory protein